MFIAFFPHTVNKAVSSLVLVRVLITILFECDKWHLMHSWRWRPSVGIAPAKAFKEGRKEGSFLTHWFPWQSFLVLIKDHCYCYTCLEFWLLVLCSPHVPQLPAATRKCNRKMAGVWRVYVYPQENCSPTQLVFSDFCRWLGKRPLGQVCYQELFWLLTNPIVFWVLVLKPSFYRFSIGTVWCLGIV